MLLTLILAAALAAPAPAACPAIAASPSELSAWTSRTPMVAGVTAENANAIVTGQARDVALSPIADVRFAAKPGKAPAAGTSGGVLTWHVDQPGTYRVALGVPAWIDVVQAGKPLASAAHAHGPACTGIRKIVDFRLQPGDYAIQIAGSPQASASLLIVKLP